MFLVPSLGLEGRRSVSVVNTSWRKTVSDGCHRRSLGTALRGACTIAQCVRVRRVCVHDHSLRNQHGLLVPACVRTCVHAFGGRRQSLVLVLHSARDDAFSFTRGIAHRVSNRKWTTYSRAFDQHLHARGPCVVHRGAWPPVGGTSCFLDVKAKVEVKFGNNHGANRQRRVEARLKYHHASRRGGGSMGGSAPAAPRLQSKRKLSERCHPGKVEDRPASGTTVQTDEESLQHHEAVQPHQARFHDQYCSEQESW